MTYKKAGFMAIAFIYLYFEWINFTDELGFFIPEDPPAPPEIGLDELIPILTCHYYCLSACLQPR